MKPYIIAKKCPAQNTICTAIKSCQQNAVSYIEDNDEPLGGRIVFNYDKGCGTCVKVCSSQVIGMKD